MYILTIQILAVRVGDVFNVRQTNRVNEAVQADLWLHLRAALVQCQGSRRRALPDANKHEPLLTAGIKILRRLHRPYVVVRHLHSVDLVTSAIVRERDEVVSRLTLKHLVANGVDGRLSHVSWSEDGLKVLGPDVERRETLGQLVSIGHDVITGYGWRREALRQ